MKMSDNVSISRNSLSSISFHGSTTSLPSKQINGEEGDGQNDEGNGDRVSLTRICLLILRLLMIN